MLTPADYLRLADEAAEQATQAQTDMIERAEKLQAGGILTQPPELTLAQLNALQVIIGSKYAEAQYWLKRREAAVDEEDERLDNESNDIAVPYSPGFIDPPIEGLFPETPDARLDPPVYSIKGSSWGQDGWSLRIYAHDTCVTVFNDTELRQAAGESGFLMLLSKLPVAAVDDSA